MKVTLLDHTPDPVYVVGEMASECYDSGDDHDTCIRRAVHCKDKGHLATMRFAYATFKIEGISRVASHQLVRVAHAGILQRSQRYVKESDIAYVIPPKLHLCAWWFRTLWRLHLSVGSWIYRLGLRHGLKKEDARFILSQSCTTSLRICMNFQAWQDLLGNRTAKAAQWEIRDVALEIRRQLHEVAPELF